MEEHAQQLTAHDHGFMARGATLIFPPTISSEPSFERQSHETISSLNGGVHQWRYIVITWFIMDYFGTSH